LLAEWHALAGDRTVVDADWLLCDGNTIGNVASGATARANADMQNLFFHLWESTTDTELPIQDSTGTLTARQATAQLDWDANYRLPLPDLRGRVPVGLDNMGGTSADVVTNVQADVLGGIEGEEKHQLTVSEMPSHRHTMNKPSGDIGAHGIGGAGKYWADGGGTHQAVVMQTTGGGNKHNTMQPYIAVNYIIKS
jgi:microcystin-dependent protein